MQILHLAILMLPCQQFTVSVEPALPQFTVSVQEPVETRKEVIESPVSTKPTTGDNSSSQPIAAVETGAGSPVVGSTRLKMSWNISGDWSPTESETMAHLKSEHGVDGTGMSHQDMLSLHDSLHNGTKSVQKSATVYRSSSQCPGGICPLQPTQYRSSGRRSRR